MKILSKNKKAFHDYDFQDEIKCWIVLHWHEVKSARLGQVSLKWSYAHIKAWELFITWLSISTYKFANKIDEYDSSRVRKLLANKKEIEKLWSKIQEKWFTLIPTYIGIDNNRIKVKIWLWKWRKKHEKREVLKNRDIDKQLRRSGLKI